MLAIRLQRTGRKGHAQFRLVVQDSHRHPTSGKVVAQLGSYNPHTKTATIDKEKVSFYLENGAQPSDRVVRMLTSEGVTMPKWVVASTNKQRTIRNTDKLRRNRPAEEVTEEPLAEATEEVVAEAPLETVAEAPEEQSAESAEEAAPAEQTEEAPAEVAATEEVPSEETAAE